MKKIFARCTLLTVLFSQLVIASLDVEDSFIEDSFTPLYSAITKTSLPGISTFIEALVETDPTGSSDHWFISRARCAYLAWAVQINQKIRRDQDKQNNALPLPESQGSQISMLEENCHHWPEVSNIQLPDLPDLQFSYRDLPYFPTDRFLTAEKESLKESLFPDKSFVQGVPSYEVFNKAGDTSPEFIRKRIVLEAILFLLGKIVLGDASQWSEYYEHNFRAIMRPFHCTRFIKRKEPDVPGFQDCLLNQSPGDVERSNFAVTLANIASGHFLSEQNVPESYSPYGYPSGYTFAASHTRISQPYSQILPGYSVIAETMVLFFLIKHASRY